MINIPDLDPEALSALQELEAKRKRGEEIDPRTLEALRAIEMASELVDSIMSGKLIDLAYFQRASTEIVKKIQGEPDQPKNIRKKVNTQVYGNK